MRYELIIFDCDGVLVDSEPIYHTVLSEMLNEIGLPFTYEESVETFAGRPDTGTKAIIEERLGKPLRSNLFIRQIKEPTFTGAFTFGGLIGSVSEHPVRITTQKNAATPVSVDRVKVDGRRLMKGI